jgi:hypothetical protein
VAAIITLGAVSSISEPQAEADRVSGNWSGQKSALQEASLVGQKRASQRSLANFSQADFWPGTTFRNTHDWDVFLLRPSIVVCTRWGPKFLNRSFECVAVRALAEANDPQ